MKHKTSHSYDIRFRELPPKVQKEPNGVMLVCPFCTLPHPLLPGVESNCGTSLRVKAVQTIIPPRLAKKEQIVCLKCHEVGGGEMVRFRGGFIHLEDCRPEMQLAVEAPKFSKLAKAAFGMSAKNPIRKAIERKYGKAQQVNEIDAKGNDTGKIAGYFFHKP